MTRVNINQLPENTNVKALKAWKTLDEMLKAEGLMKEQYDGSWISRNMKYLMDMPKRYQLKKEVYGLYGLNRKERQQVDRLMGVYSRGYSYRDNSLYYATA